MDYRKEIRKLEKGRERYFPVMAALMDMKLPEEGRPVQLTDPDMMRTVLELVDIGYLDADAFIINKRFSEIRGLYFRGGQVLTAAGWKEFEKNYMVQKRRNLRRLLTVIAILSVLLAMFTAVSLFK